MVAQRLPHDGALEWVLGARGAIKVHDEQVIHRATFDEPQRTGHPWPLPGGHGAAEAVVLLDGHHRPVLGAGELDQGLALGLDGAGLALAVGADAAVDDALHGVFPLVAGFGARGLRGVRE